MRLEAASLLLTSIFQSKLRKCLIIRDGVSFPDNIDVLGNLIGSCCGLNKPGGKLRYPLTSQHHARNNRE
jgi:hypothetical protein